MKLQESGENYLETILILHQRTGFVRSVDIANEMGFSKPSISHAMGLLKDGGYITMDPRTNQILLTPAGEAYHRRVIGALRDIELECARLVGTEDMGRAHDINTRLFDAFEEALKKEDRKDEETR